MVVGIGRFAVAKFGHCLQSISVFSGSSASSSFLRPKVIWVGCLFFVLNVLNVILAFQQRMATIVRDVLSILIATQHHGRPPDGWSESSLFFRRPTTLWLSFAAMPSLHVLFVEIGAPGTTRRRVFRRSQRT